jgi:hypothetical protein
MPIMKLLRVPSKASVVVTKPEPRQPVPAAKGTGKFKAKPMPKSKDEKLLSSEYKTFSLRADATHQAMIARIMNTLSCDKTEAVKRWIRIGNHAYSAHNAELILTDEQGNKTTIPIMSDGVPC